jgi:DNA-binding IclR family transcriptional regulator
MVTAGERGVEQTLGRAATLLDALAGAREHGLRFTDLVNASGYSKATVHRLLAGLRTYGFVELDAATDRFFLGLRLGGWGTATMARYGLVERTAPILRDLASRLDTTVYLILRDGPMSLCVSRFVGSHPIRALPLTPGDRNALGVGSGSLAMLAFLDDKEIDRILHEPENMAARERRNIPITEIRRLVAMARKKGYAMTDRLTPGMIGIGMPVHSTAGDPVVAVSVASVSSQMRGRRHTEMTTQLRLTVSAIEQALLKSADNPEQYLAGTMLLKGL